MSASELLSLRRKRRRVCANLAKLEPLVADYRAKLCVIEARMQTLDPQLWLPPRRYKPNPVFARQELPWLALAILRGAREPLAAKGVTLPELRVMKTTRVRLQQFLGKLDQRGVTRKVGRGMRRGGC